MCLSPYANNKRFCHHLQRDTTFVNWKLPPNYLKSPRGGFPFKAAPNEKGGKYLSVRVTSHVSISRRGNWYTSIPAGTCRLYNVGSTWIQRYDVASTVRRRCLNVMCPMGWKATLPTFFCLPSENRPTTKIKNLFPLGANSFLL